MAEEKQERYTAADLMKMFGEFRVYKSALLPEWRLIRALYRGRFWQIFQKHMKEYTLTPDWNYFEYVVSAYLNSIYSGAFIGTLTPIKAEHEEAVEALNAFIAYQWNKWGMKNKYLHVGENGELYNLGAVRVDWKSSTDDIELAALTPDEVYLDPSVDDYRKGRAIFIERSVNVDELKKEADYKQEVEAYLKNKKNLTDKTRPHRMAGGDNVETSNNRTVSFIECFIRNKEGNIDQVFILDEEIIVFSKIDTPMCHYPVAIYQPSRPDASPYGNSKLVKIFNTVVTLNLIDSMESTQPYRLLNRVRFVNVDGRVNMRAFAEYGATPGASFETHGDPKGIIHYEDVPIIPDQTNLKNRLENSIFQQTGVDMFYKGRQTNSLQTTGATQAFQARVTMLTDNSRIVQLEEFTEHLTRVIAEMHFQYGKNEKEVPKMSVTGTRKVVDTYTVNFKQMRKDNVKFDYFIAASTLLPMNQANLFEAAKALYEMQGQYGFKHRVVTEEDIVRYSDFPNKDLYLQRIEKEKRENTGEDLVADLTNFASIFSKLLGNGLSEEQAAQQAISILIEEKNAMMQNPAIGRGFE